jgi:outer membrane protein assembly factor BamB
MFNGYNDPLSNANDKVYFGSPKYQVIQDGYIYCLNADDGEIVWLCYVVFNIYSVISISDVKIFVRIC